MRSRRILVLGGTASARALADELLDEGHDVITSLAGVTRQPMLPAGKTRFGGFGGAEGLLGYLRAEAIDAIADATHPFAARISAHASEAAGRAGIPCFRLEAPAWQPAKGDRWSIVNSVGDAARSLPAGARPMVTIGRKEIGSFFERSDLQGFARMIETPDMPVPQSWTLCLARPPFSLEQESAILAKHRITHLVCKNAGGESTKAKIVAARERKIPVVMVARPKKPDGPAFASIKEIREALLRALSS